MAFYDEWNNVKNYWGVGTFTDDPIVADQTEESKRHWNELRTKLKELDSRGHRGTRNFSGGSVTSGFETWSAGNFTNDPLSESDKLRAVHMNELRDKFKTMPSDAHMRGSWFVSFENQQELISLPQSSKVIGFWKFEVAGGVSPSFTWANEVIGGEVLTGVFSSVVPAKLGNGILVANNSISGPSDNGLLTSGFSFTLSTWVYLSQLPSVTGNKVILAQFHATGYGDEIYNLYIGTDNKFHFKVKTFTPATGFGHSEIIGNTVVEVGKWYMVTAVFTDVGTYTSTLDLYLGTSKDATQVGGVDALVGLTAGTGYFRALSGLVGIEDELKLWKNSALDQTEITQLYMVECSEQATSSLQFGEDPVVADQTKIRRCHIMELRGLLKSISDNVQLCTCHSVCSCHGQCCDCDHGSGGI